MSYVAYKIDWEESERGWGCRPDGISLHSSQAHADQYIKEYWAKQPAGPAPDEYSRPLSGMVEPFEVDDTLFKQLQNSKNGIRIWQNQLREMKEKKG